MESVLQNPMILEYIFQYSSFRDLKRCRQVSRLWRDSCRKAFKASAVIKISRDEGLSSFAKFALSKKSAGNVQPFVNFRFRYVNFGKTKYYQNKFLASFGSHIKMLVLENCEFATANLMRHVIYQACPNLECLHLMGNCITSDPGSCASNNKQQQEFDKNCSVKCLEVDDSFRNYRQFSWMELLSHFPSLEVLKLHSSKHTQNELFGGINKLRQDDGSVLNIKEIFVEMKNEEAAGIPGELYALLLDSRLQMSKLSLYLNWDDDEMRLSQIFAQHGQFLRHLEIRSLHNKPSLEPNGCFASSPLNNLVELKLHNRVFTTIDFLKFTPKLRKLSLFEASSIITDDVDTSTKLEDCVELELLNFVSVRNMRILVNMLPNIVRLRMPLNNGTFEIVCQGWTKLLSLDVIDSAIDDGGITGFDVKTVERINNRNIKSGEEEFVRKKANITCLNYLQRLSFSFPKITLGPASRWSKYSMGFCAAHYGVAQIPNLLHLYVHENRMKSQSRKFHSEWQNLLHNYAWPFGSDDLMDEDRVGQGAFVSWEKLAA